jgi:hypothetical protein
MNANRASLLVHALILVLVILCVFMLAALNKISGGEGLAVIAAAGGVGVAGAIGVSVGSKGNPPG